MKNWFMIIGLLLAGLAHAAEDEASLQPVANPQPILDELQRQMKPVKSVYFEFTQERRLKLFTEPLKSEGAMMVEQPDQIRWETTAPYQSILLGNRKSVAQFERPDGHWKKLKLGFPQMLRRVMDQMSLVQQGKLDTLTNDFTVSVATNRAKVVVTMIPNDENVRSMLAALEIQMQPDFSTTREVVMREPGGDFTRIIFRREKRNVQFPPGTFDQSKPLDLAAIKTAVGDDK